MHGCVTYSGPAWDKPRPLAVSDTVDNLLTAEGVPARAIHNRSAGAMLLYVRMQDGFVAVFRVNSGDALYYGYHWRGINATGTTNGGASGLSYEVIHTTVVGAAFGNQPANDGIEVLSDDADDDSDVVIYGTTQGTDTVVAETITLDGTTPVASVKTDWGVILGVEKAVTEGTITVREASGDAAITTLLPAATSKGVETVTAGTSYNARPVATASGATTKQIGIAGTNAAGTVIYDSQALTGATAAPMNSSFATVTKIFTGDVENTVTVTIGNGADLLVVW